MQSTGMIVQEGVCLYRKKNRPLLIEQWVKSEKILNNKTIEAAKIHEEKSYCLF
ncbi:hypothetical protein J2772_001591 [Chryseobacterium jejuense]|nr:hypothetical protein [Chryseobacterium jejuense]